MGQRRAHRRLPYARRPSPHPRRRSRRLPQSPRHAHPAAVRFGSRRSACSSSTTTRCTCARSHRRLKPHRGRVQIELTSNGIDALVMVGSFKPDLIVLDVYMPELDGIEVLPTPQAQARDAPHRGHRHQRAFDQGRRGERARSRSAGLRPETDGPEGAPRAPRAAANNPWGVERPVWERSWKDIVVDGTR